MWVWNPRLPPLHVKVLPYDKTNKCCFSETTKFIQSTLYVNSHVMVPCKVSIFLSESEIQDAYYHQSLF
jgi:hypothetical protein